MSRNFNADMRTAPLRVGSWNARSAIFKAQQIEHFISDLQLDILALQETWLSDEHEFKLRGFAVYRRDRVGRPGGGVALALRRELPQLEAEIPAIALASLEAVGAYVWVGNGRLLVVSVYCPDQTLDPAGIDALLALNSKVILVGDFNARHRTWGGLGANRNGSKIANLVATRRGVVICAPNSPTHFPDARNRNPGVIDFMIVKGVECVVPRSIAALDSDHNPITCVVASLAAKCQIKFRTSRDTDWAGFSAQLNSQLEQKPVNTKDEIDEAVTHLTATLNSAFKRNTVVTRVENSRPELSDEQRRILRELRRTVKVHRRYGDPVDGERARSLSREFRSSLREEKTAQWSETISKCNLHERHIWDLSRALGRKPGVNCPIQSNAGTGAPGAPPPQPVYAWDDATKSEIFASSLELQFRAFETGAVAPPLATTFTGCAPVARTTCCNAIGPLFPLSSARRVTGAELREALRSVSVRKAAGPDGLNGAQLRALGGRGVEFLLELLNACLACGYFPKAWRIATIALIPKPGKNKLTPSSYRPISLLSILGKTFERLILSRLQQEIRRLTLLRDEQFGFRAGHSSAQQLTRLCTEIGLALERRQNLPAVFLDMRSAFDSVWHAGLLECLTESGMSDCYVRLIASFLSDRQFKVRVNNVYSSLRRAEAGVPQGSVLSPTLFGLYVNDAPLPAETKTGIQRCGLLMFADDFAYYAKSANVGQSVKYLSDCLAALPEWLSRKRLALNLDKCVAVNFTRKRANPDETVSLAGARLPWRSEARYLGVLLDSGLRWHAHARYLAAKLQNRTLLLKPLLRSPELSISLKRRLFTACVRPLWAYACEVFAAAPSSTLHPIRVAENRAARLAARPHLSNLRHDRTPKNADVFRVLGVRNQFPAELQKRAETALARALRPSAPRILRETGAAANSGVHRAFHRRKGPKHVAFTFRALPPHKFSELCDAGELTVRGRRSPLTDAGTCVGGAESRSAGSDPPGPENVAAPRTPE